MLLRQAAARALVRVSAVQRRTPRMRRSTMRENALLSAVPREMCRHRPLIFLRRPSPRAAYHNRMPVATAVA